MSEWRDLPPPPDPDEPGWAGDVSISPAPTSNPDHAGIAAIVLGCVGIVVLGLFLVVPVALLAALSGARAREQGRPLDNATIAFVLAAVDGVVWVALHLLIDFPTWAG